MESNRSRTLAWLPGPCRLVFLALFLASGAARGADDPPREKPPEAVLPGRIFLSVYGRQSVQRGILAVDPNDGTCVTITPEGNQGIPRVSPDGRRIALQRIQRPTEEGPRFSIGVIDADGEKPPVPIFEGTGWVCWAGRDHVIISTEGFGGPEPGVWLVNADGSGKVKLSLPESDRVSEASADGQWLLVHSARTADHAALEALDTNRHPTFLIRRDGKLERQLLPAGTPMRKTVGDPPSIVFADLHFSPDGKRVHYNPQRVDSPGRAGLANSKFPLGRGRRCPFRKSPRSLGCS